MTSRERMQAALSGKETDRVPFFPCIYIDHACFATGHDFEEAIADPRLGIRLMLEANSLYHSDVVRVLMTPPRKWFDEKEVRRDGGDLVQVDQRTGKTDGRFDVYGGGKLIPTKPVPPVETLDDATRIAWPDADELLETGCMDAAHEVCEMAHEKDLFVVGITDGQTLNFLVERCGSTEIAMLALVEQRELAMKLIDIATATSIAVGNAFAEIGVDCLYIGDSYASGSVISSQMYEEYCAPAYQRAADAAHANGLLVYNHCCGNCNPLLESIKEERLDGIEGIDPTAGMSVAATRKALGDALCLIGGVSCLTLLQATPEEVYAESCACIEAGGRSGRYVLGSACAVPRFTPTENMHAFAKAALETN